MKVRGIPLPLSQSFRDVNPQLGGKNAAQARSRTRIGLRCGMNKTESEFALILEAQKRAGEILRYEFEGITLRFANVKYTPDFLVVSGLAEEYRMGGVKLTRYVIEKDAKAPRRIKFIEVKGPFIKGNRERAVERFRHAKTYWPEFSFEMWQKKDGRWTQII